MTSATIALDADKGPAYFLGMNFATLQPLPADWRLTEVRRIVRSAARLRRWARSGSVSTQTSLDLLVLVSASRETASALLADHRGVTR